MAWLKSMMHEARCTERFCKSGHSKFDEKHHCVYKRWWGVENRLPEGLEGTTIYPLTNISHLFARLTTRCQAPQQIGLSSAKRQLVKPSSLLIKWRAQFSEAHKFTSLKEYRQPNSTSQNWRGCQILLAAIFKFISAPMASRQQKNARASSNFSQQQEEKPF